MKTDTIKAQAVLPQTDLQIARAAFAAALKSFIEKALPERWEEVEKTQAEVEALEKSYHNAYLKLLAHVCAKQGRK